MYSLRISRTALVLLSGSLFLQLGCNAVGLEQLHREMPAYSDDLLSGKQVFGNTVVMAEAPVHEVLAVTPEMRKFVDDLVSSKLSVVRFNRLLKKLEKAGYFNNRYNASVTHTAAETFNTRVGNCISYTSLFVALARLVDLSVSYQLVETTAPSFNVDAGLLIRNNHINLAVEGPRFDREHASGYTVDFNLVDPEPEAQVYKIGDSYALSLFYANLFVHQILLGNERLGFAYLLRAIDAEPRNPDLWVNLGAFYGRHRLHAQAVQAYQVAQRLKPNERVVLAGLERSYRLMGKISEADELAARVQKYRRGNAYFQFAVAQLAYDEKNYGLSLEAIDRAIRIKSRDARFHYLKSLVHAERREPTAAKRSLQRAKRYGRF